MFVGSCFKILTENLGMRQACKIHSTVSHGWTKREPTENFNRSFLKKAEADENFMQSIITGDGTCVYGFDVDRNRLTRPSAVMSPTSMATRLRDIHAENLECTPRCVCPVDQ